MAAIENSSVDPCSVTASTGIAAPRSGLWSMLANVAFHVAPSPFSTCRMRRSVGASAPCQSPLRSWADAPPLHSTSAAKMHTAPRDMHLPPPASAAGLGCERRLSAVLRARRHDGAVAQRDLPDQARGRAIARAAGFDRDALAFGGLERRLVDVTAAKEAWRRSFERPTLDL